MSQKAGNNVKAPVHGNTAGRGASPQQDTSETRDEQYHGENHKSLQDDRRVGQHNQAGRPPLMKK